MLPSIDAYSHLTSVQYYGGYQGLGYYGAAGEALQVRTAPSWPRSRANSSLF